MTHKGDEEEDDVDDAERKGRLEQRARLIRIQTPYAVAGFAVIAEHAEVKVEAARGEIDAVGVRDTAEEIYTCNKGTDKGEVDECDEEGRVSGAEVGDEGCDCPCGC